MTNKLPMYKPLFSLFATILFSLLAHSASASNSNTALLPKGNIILTTKLLPGDKIELRITAEAGEVTIEGAKGTWVNEELCQYELTSSTLIIKGDISLFSAWNARLTTLDVSQMPQLLYLEVPHNALEALDLSSNEQLVSLSAYDNRLISLQVNGLKKLFQLTIKRNKLRTLDVSGCEALQWIECFRNELSKEAMSQFLSGLPEGVQGEWRRLVLIDLNDHEEQNYFISDKQVKIATDKEWNVFDYNGGEQLLFSGFTRVATE